MYGCIDHRPRVSKECGVLCFSIQRGLDIIKNVADILKALSRFRQATLPLTILLVFLVSLSTPVIYAASADSAFSMKIGPLLRKTIEESIKVPVDKQAGTRVPMADQTPGPLYKVIVVIDSDFLKPLSPEVIEELRKRVELLGGHIGNHAYNNVQVWISLDKIENLLEWPKIIRVDEPLIPQTHSIISEGTGLIGATSGNNRGLTGKGVKVGIIDTGFQGYNALLGIELPASVKTKVMGSDAIFTSNTHGTACAEIVHDVAPEAELFLVNAADFDVDFHNSVSWLLSQGVHVISSSIGINLKLYVSLLYWALKGPSGSAEYVLAEMQNLDRIKSQWDLTINSAVSGGGITWAQAAGNDGQKKWLGSFNDSDGDYYLNFTSSQNYNEIDVFSAQSGDELYVAMMWGLETNLSTYDDFDLIVLDENGTEVCSSRTRQATFPLGMEACKFTVDPLKRYAVKVLQWWTTKPHEIGILLGHDKFPKFINSTSSKTVTLSPPAHNPNVITVGAVPYNTPNIIEPYSSQGPNIDGIIKPDIAAPDCVSAASWSGPFCGTSAAAPHVAGLCALIKQAYPNALPSQIKSYLEETAIDLGATGKDNVFGSGLVQLPSDIMVAECSLTLSPKGYGYNSQSNTGTIIVTAPFSSCTWTATSNDSWVTVTSGATGTGSDTVGYSVAANTGTARTGTLVIGGQTFTVTQTDTVTFTQAQLDQAVTDANAAKDVIIASMFTQQQLNQAVAEERIKWDINGDGKMGLEEVLFILQKVAGMR